MASRSSGRLGRLLFPIVAGAIAMASALAAADENRSKAASEKLHRQSEQLELKRLDRLQLVEQLQQLIDARGYEALDFNAPDIPARLYLLVLARPELFQTVLAHHAMKLDEGFGSCLADVRLNLVDAIQLLEAQISLPRLGPDRAAQGVPPSYALARQRVREYQHSLLFIDSLEQAQAAPRSWSATVYAQIRFQRAQLEARSKEAFSQLVEQLPGSKALPPMGSILIRSWFEWSPLLTCASAL